jgi:hypothetical protein
MSSRQAIRVSAGRDPALPAVDRRSAPRALVGLGMLALALLVGCDSSRPPPTGPEPPPTLPSNYRVEIDAELGTPRWVLNSETSYRPGAPAPFSDAEAFQIVRSFVVQNAAVFRFRPGVDDFVATHFSGSNGENLVKITQTYRGLIVDYMGYGTSVLANGHVGSMSGRFMPWIEVRTLPKVSLDVAREKSIAALAPTVVTVRDDPRLMVTTFNLVPRLALSTVVGNGWLTWTVMVDALTAEVLGVRANFILN